MMAMENATGEEESVEAQVDVVCFARTRLRKLQPKAPCAWSRRATVARLRKQSITQHEHGSVGCIVVYLGKENWSRRKVSDIVKLKDKLHPSVLKTLRTDRRSDHKTSLGQRGVTTPSCGYVSTSLVDGTSATTSGQCWRMKCGGCGLLSCSETLRKHERQ